MRQAIAMLLLASLATGCTRNRRKWATLTLGPAPVAPPLVKSVRLEFVDKRGQAPSPVMNAEELISNPVSSFTRSLLVGHLLARGIGVGAGSGPTLKVELLDAWWLVDVNTVEVHAFARLHATLLDSSGEARWSGYGARGETVAPGVTPFLEWESQALRASIEGASVAAADSVMNALATEPLRD